MNAQEFLAEMKTILADERNALRRLDAKTVTEAGIRKEVLLKTVLDVPASERQGYVTALAEIKVELRRNLVLLAHARDYLRDAITLCTQTKQAARPRLQASL